MKKEKIRIAVTGMNASDSPGPGVPVIRAIRAAREFDGEIVGFSYDPLDPGNFMEALCDHVYLFSYPSEGSSVLLDRIRAVHDATPLDVIIPTLDSELAAYIAIQEDLSGMGIKTFLPTKQDLDVRSKARFVEMGERLGIRVPRGKAVTDPSIFRTLDRELSYPVMVKGQFYEAYIAYSPMEAEHHFRVLASKWGLPVVVQEFIIGEEYDIVALGDGAGGLIGAVPMKKMQLTDKGKAWGGVTIRDPEMNAFVRDAMARLKWRGPCEFEVMKSTKDDACYLIELNPRFPAWCYLAVGAGQNLPWAAVRLARGETVAPFEDYDLGVMFIRNSIDHIYPLSDYQELTVRGELHKK